MVVAFSLDHFWPWDQAGVDQGLLNEIIDHRIAITFMALIFEAVAFHISEDTHLFSEVLNTLGCT